MFLIFVNQLQSKFYKGAGIIFNPFSLDAIVEEALEAEPV